MILCWCVTGRGTQCNWAADKISAKQGNIEQIERRNDEAVYKTGYFLCYVSLSVYFYILVMFSQSSAFFWHCIRCKSTSLCDCGDFYDNNNNNVHIYRAPYMPRGYRGAGEVVVVVVVVVVRKACTRHHNYRVTSAPPSRLSLCEQKCLQ